MKTFDEIREQFKHVNCGTDDCCQQCDTAVTEAKYAVEVEGLPTVHVDAKNPGEIKQKFRKMLKKPDMLKSIDRVTDADVKKHHRGKLTGKTEAKVECPKCEGKGCDHCDDKGYHMSEAMSSKEKAAHAKAIADFKKRGGKVKKLKPGYAQGYHGKDDPGKGVAGMLSKPDSSKFKKGKKVRSMRADMSERVIDAKKMDAYRKFAKAKKVDDDSIRMAVDNPKHAETKRMMKDKNFVKALKMYQAAGK